MNRIDAINPSNNFHYVRINKTSARKAYNDNREVLLIGCNLMPFGPWTSPCAIHKEAENPTEFNSMVNSFEYYNTCSERGYYASYYISNKRTNALNGYTEIN
jgi:hypothetical protein